MTSTAPRYNIVDDYLPVRPTSDEDRNKVDYVSYSPYCIVLVLPLSLPASCDRSRLSIDMQGKSVSFSDDPADGVRLRSDPLIITDDLMSATTHAAKGSYLSQLQVQLGPSTINYLAAVLPGDWVFCWMLTSEVKALDVIERIKKLKPCNLWLDGLRFVGKVGDVQRERTAKHSGLNVVRTSVSAVGFSELGSQVFYDPYLAEATPLMGTWLARIGGAISDLLGTPLDSGGGLDVNKLMPFFVNLLLGEGIANRYANPSGESQLQLATGLTRSSSKEAPYALVCPGQVGLLLGKRNPERSTVLAYADLLELLTGVQRFTNGAGATASPAAPWAIFTPDGVDVPPAADGVDFPDALSRKKTNTPLLGQFIPTIPSFANKDVWTILRQWLNPVVNEMFTALRANEVGQVVPTIVVRQMPLSSEAMANIATQSRFVPSIDGSIVVTPFLEVPRWVGHPCLVRSDVQRRSDALRFNFVHVYGQSLDSQVASRYTAQLVRSPPARNDLDIQRSGLRAFMATVACSITESASGEGAKRWIAFASDWLMDQHLTLSGVVTVELVPGPIPPGDNFEYDGVVSQIEGVQHHFEVSNGQKRAYTTLSLTHGLRSDTDPAYSERSGEEGDSYLFAGLRKDDQRTYDSSVSVENPRQVVRYQNSGAIADVPGGGSSDPSGDLDKLLGGLK